MDLIVEHLKGDRDEFLRRWIAARDAESPSPWDLLSNFSGPAAPGQGTYRPDPPLVVTESSARVTSSRLVEILNKLEVQHVSDDAGNLLAVWKRHVVQISLEGPDESILVVRMRPNATARLALREATQVVVNEWNHTRRFLKAYIADPTPNGRLPLYGEMQLPVSAGVNDAFLLEFLDAGLAVATTYTEWLFTEGVLEEM
ncbi:YbjN domain-containing protein [Micromonospora orduensis]|uniref:YbjN domain-containing protein n=1 Tax=Micromonospora orduensis TaxID=1420891 RepID=UPI001FCB2863|nr:YbjN domain-containing protein [Micromonospora orduensis]